MLNYLEYYLSTFLWYLIAPVLYHTSVDGSTSYYCLLLIDFTDAYAAYIISIFFILMFLITKNYIFKVFYLLQNVTSNVQIKAVNYNITSSTYSTIVKYITLGKNLFKK